MIIHSSSPLLTAELPRWETMREVPAVSAPGLHPKKLTLDKLESRGPALSLRAPSYVSQKQEKKDTFLVGATKKRRDRSVRIMKEEEKNGEFSYASLEDGDK